MQHECACGCGQLVKRTYVHGHNRRQPERYTVEDRGYRTPCWIWQGAKTSQGYGAIRIGRSTVGAHRVYYERVHGPIGRFPLDHLCRQPPCVNPDHVEPVTVVMNTRRGLSARLTLEKAEEIRHLALAGWRGGEIAEAYGVSPQLVCDIRMGRKWVAV
jgi:hypothetical protein